MWELQYFTDKYERKTEKITKLMMPKFHLSKKAFRFKNNFDI